MDNESEIQGDSWACDVPASFSAGAAQGLIEAHRADISPALVHVAAASLLCSARFCPLQRLFQRQNVLAGWLWEGYIPGFSNFPEGQTQLSPGSGI